MVARVLRYAACVGLTESDLLTASKSFKIFVSGFEKPCFDTWLQQSKIACGGHNNGDLGLSLVCIHAISTDNIG